MAPVRWFPMTAFPVPGGVALLAASALNVNATSTRLDLGVRWYSGG